MPVTFWTIAESIYVTIESYAKTSPGSLMTSLERNVLIHSVPRLLIAQSGLIPDVIVRRSLTVISASRSEIVSGRYSIKNVATLSSRRSLFSSIAIPIAILTNVFELEY